MKATWFLEQIKSPVVSSKFPLGGGSRRVACMRVCARARAPARSGGGGAGAGAGAAVTSDGSKGLGLERLW